MKLRPEQRTAAMATFSEYFVKNYPGPHTIIGDPTWHAPKIFRAALHAFESESNYHRCVWTQEQDYPVYYAGCKENEEFHLAPGKDLYPCCHWCGGLIEIGSQPDGEGVK